MPIFHECESEPFRRNEQDSVGGITSAESSDCSAYSVYIDWGRGLLEASVPHGKSGESGEDLTGLSAMGSVIEFLAMRDSLLNPRGTLFATDEAREGNRQISLAA
jgi:hypothetical protein